MKNGSLGLVSQNLIPKDYILVDAGNTKTIVTYPISQPKDKANSQCEAMRLGLAINETAMASN